MVRVGARVGEGFIVFVGVGEGDGVSEGPSVIGLSTGGAGCSPPQEARSKSAEKHNNIKVGNLKFPEGLL